MTDRVSPGDGSPACPFIAFEDERDERSSSPDHRHRCYAEVRPAPRALAHQEAYCLSSAFPVCPTFQDWARREAARAKTQDRPSVRTGAPPEPVKAAAVVVPSLDDAEVVDPDGVRDDDADLWAGAPSDEDEPVIHRNPPRDWAAPPPWATGAGPGAASRSGADDRPADPVPSRAPGQGLAGSSADRMASGLPIAAAGVTAAAAGSDDLADLVAPPTRPQAPSAQPPITRPPSGHFPTTSAAGRRPSVSSTREQPAVDHDGPSWERARRYEAYPTIKTRASLPGIPRIALWGGALVLAAMALFFLPGLFSSGGGATPGSSASPTPSASEETASPTVTAVPSPTEQTYTIKKGDTLNKIAKKFKVTVDQILEANKDTIPNPNKIRVGDVIIIPVSLPDEIVDPSAEAPSASATD